MATPKSSVESLVFRKLYAKLQDGVQVDLNAFAGDLYSKKLITEGTRNSATNQLVDSGSRAISLLNAIEEKIKISEGVFWEILEILEVYQKDLAGELKRECEKFWKKSEQCDDTDLSLPSVPVRKLTEIREEVLSGHPCSTDLPNGRDLRGQYGPQSDTNKDEDLTEQAPIPETADLATPSEHHIAEQYDPPLQQVFTGPGRKVTDGTLNRFFKIVTKAANELCTEKEAEVAEVKRQYEQCHAEVVEHYEHEIKRLEAEIEHLESENKLIESSRKLEIDHLKKSHEREKASFQEAMQSQEQQLRTSEAVRKKKEEELAELRGKYHKKQLECTDLREQLAEKEGELRELEIRLTEAERESEGTTAPRKVPPKSPPRVRPETKIFALQEVKEMLQTFQGIRSLMHQLCEGKDELELTRIRKQLKRKVTDLKASARRRKSDSWPPSN